MGLTAPGGARPHGVTATPLGSYGYNDANGNLTAGGPGEALGYDGENRLVSVDAVQLCLMGRTARG